MLFSEQPPLAHSKYIVKRDGYLFTATPCYGCHEPWWVVKTMDGEAPPVPMKDDDDWQPLVPCFFAFVKDTEEYGEPVFLIAIQEFWNEHHCLDDHHISSQIKLPPCLVEIQESVFGLNPETECAIECTMEQSKQHLLAMGYVENQEMLP